MESETLLGNVPVDLLYQALETEKGGVQIYSTALRCAINKDLREETPHIRERLLFLIAQVDKPFQHCKTIGASGEGIEILEDAGAINRTADTGGPKRSDQAGVVTDAKGGMLAAKFGRAIAQHRHWDARRRYE